jgi:hypothetical protein
MIHGSPGKLRRHSSRKPGVNSPSWLILVFVALMFALIGAAIWLYVALRMQRAEFWEFQIRAYEENDRRCWPDPGAILFTGSSSIRYWRTLERDMDPLPVFNRGFGGCHLSHVIHCADRIIFPYRPKAIVLYAGENDLGWTSRKRPGIVLQDFQRFVELARSKLPMTRVYFISIKLARLRRGRWRAMREANKLVEEFARGREGVAFIDTTTAMLNPSGAPKPEFLPWYRMHMTARGYALWSAIVKPILMRDLRREALSEDGKDKPEDT